MSSEEHPDRSVTSASAAVDGLQDLIHEAALSVSDDDRLLDAAFRELHRCTAGTSTFGTLALLSTSCTICTISTSAVFSMFGTSTLPSACGAVGSAPVLPNFGTTTPLSTCCAASSSCSSTSTSRMGDRIPMKNEPCSAPVRCRACSAVRRASLLPPSSASPAKKRALLPAVALLASACLFGARLAFLPAAGAAPRQHEALLRAGAAAAAAAAPALVIAEPDELVDYNFAGEFTPFMIIGYFTLTTALTGFSFVSYLVLTKLKII
ncbi:unnamed protein product [Prorocentrum cordatum]|uniref:Uncharacterized protein n=1 Tax=Prorocentrum cordatum TaxID=2364126 RepID=A0ABN9URG0_9DINO|nr:unnamed protein product [Polarella glacialis]